MKASILFKQYVWLVDTIQRCKRITLAELKVRRWLWHHGYRYRLNVKSVPGKPDIVMRPYRTAIFVNGCFWHGHGVEIENSKLKIIEKAADPGAALIENSACCKIPQSNRAFWVAKIRRNQERDQRNYQLLQENGWQVIVVWECQLTPKQIEHTMREVELLLNNNMLARYKHSPNPFTTEEEPLPLAAEDTIEYQDNRRHY